jgi:GNAT superfamily N-acetyltransferase
MMGEVEVRPAVPDDAATILTLMRELARHDGMEGYVTTTEERIRDTCFGDNPACHLLTAEVNGEVIGYVSYTFNWENWSGVYYLALNELYVREDGRGRGTGRRLMQEVARVALERDCWARWEVVPSNRRALDFYRKLGAYPSDWRICWWSQGAMRALLVSPGA